MPNTLHTILHEHGHSITKPRLKVFEELLATQAPISVADLAKRLNSVDKVSIYRTIELFENTGVVHRIWTGFKSKVELSDAFSPHHHHFTCRSCSKTISIKSEALETTLHEFETTHSFRLTHHSVELSGYCLECKDRV